ncbi:MAG: hypothetical protein KJZ78_08405, partial [Bryobacteraceae bacterium]|nr:hypothetical protein [Bryobacteraceae bacterium]
TVVGIAIGTGSALAAGRLLSNLLYEMNGNDPAVLAGGALVMIATCLVAVWGPVNRAMRVNPARAVRYE